MHTMYRLLAAAVVLWALLSSASASAEEIVKLRIRADSWMPFNGDPSAGQPGYVVEFLREVFEPQGIKVDYQIMPWADAVKAAEAGEVEGIIGANRKEAENLLVGSMPIAEPRFALFVLKTNPWRYENLRSLQTVKIGAIEGYSYWASIDGYIAKYHAPAVKLYYGEAPLTEALEELDGGKIDVVVESVLVFHWAVKSRGKKFTDYRIAYNEVAEPLFVAFAKNEAGRKYTKLFDQGLKKLKDNGRFDAILEGYGFTKR